VPLPYTSLRKRLLQIFLDYQCYAEPCSGSFSSALALVDNFLRQQKGQALHLQAPLKFFSGNILPAETTVSKISTTLCICTKLHRYYGGTKMFDREREEQHLAVADKHIEAAEIRIQKLMDRLDELREKKLNTKQTEQLLSLMVQVLITMQRHRNLILKRLKDGF
jgi:hypothetical protein